MSTLPTRIAIKEPFEEKVVTLVSGGEKKIDDRLWVSYGDHNRQIADLEQQLTDLQSAADELAGPLAEILRYMQHGRIPTVEVISQAKSALSRYRSLTSPGGA